jgi:glycosyltransferase involved in cell wall biosynthesis
MLNWGGGWVRPHGRECRPGIRSLRWSPRIKRFTLSNCSNWIIVAAPKPWMPMKLDRAKGPGCGANQNTRASILFLAPSMTLAGPQRQLLYLAKGLDRAKFKPMLVLFDDAKPEHSYDYTGIFERVFRLAIPSDGNFVLGRIPWLVLGSLRLLHILRRERPDVVHAFLPVPSVMGALVSRLVGVPAFIVGRRSLSALPRRGSRILTWIDRFPSNLADAILANCEAVAKDAEQGDGVAARRIYTIPNGVDVETFSHGRDHALRRFLGYGEGEVVFGMIANFLGCKRHADFVEAARQIHSQRSNSRFLLVGVDHGTLPQIRQQILSSGMENVIQIVAGTKTPQRYYRAMDVYICSSESEGMSNSVAEAMGSGLAVIATNVGGNSELIRNGETGFLTGIGHPEEIAGLACRLQADPLLRESIGMKARLDVSARFPMTAMVNVHEALYAELLGLAPGAPNNPLRSSPLPTMERQ